MLSTSEQVTLRFRNLGAVDVEDDGQVRAPGGAILGRLLARLLIDAGRRLDVFTLVDAVWGDLATARSASTLDSHLHRLRRFLEPDRARGQAPVLLVADAAGYRLTVDDERVDSVRFARLVTEAGALLAGADAGRAVQRAEEARTLWRGRPFTPWSDEPWAAAAVARLEELGRQLTEVLVDALLADSHPERALVELEPVLAADPLRERPWEQYMLAAARAGRVEDALTTYRRVDRLFRDELGVEPGAELRRLQQLVLSGGAAVAAGTAAPEPEPVAPAPAQPEVHLPRRRSRLIGRDEEVADLARRLTPGATVTVVGVGGCGKTTLAVATAERLAPRFPGGIWFVDLTSALDAEQVGAAAASALGLAGDGSGTAVDTLQTFTRARRMLLVLDNCEHVLDPVAELVEDLRLPGSRLAVLATSREPLEVEGEDVVELAPLPVGDTPSSPAVELFLERLAGAGPDRRIGAGDLGLAVTICASVDGVPLAIELAAARGRAFSLHEIAEQVRADPSSLSRVGRGRGGRQSVRAAVERSVRLLTPEEQELHAAMSVVPGPMTARMAAALVGEQSGDADDSVAGLVHRSLLVAEGPLRSDGPSRFAQLAIVRGHGAHALGKAGSERVDDLRDQVVVDAVASRPRLGMTGEAQLHDAMDDDLPALRAALHRTLIDAPTWGGPALAAGLGMYWFYRGMMLEGSRWIGLGFDHRGLARPVDSGLMHSNVATLHIMGRDLPAARPHLDALFETADRATGEDLLFLGDEFAGLTSPAFPAGDRALLRELADRAAAVADRTGDANSALLARVAALRARPRDAAEQLAEAAAVHAAALASGNQWAGRMSAADAVHACLAADDVEAALEWSQRGAEDHLALGARDSPQFMELHGVLHARRGDVVSAVRYLSGARAQNRRAAMRWPTRPETPAILEEAARGLGAAAYEQAWREGSGLQLADVVPGGAALLPRADSPVGPG